ncbi:hypothetical protein SLEP1_g42601 [Rubroshorea leprosula]|uniref:Uncharacterized protein n=1 Tax=Rubroshorea leprosula TaxID=152421 RepID=A0AAV5LAD1_9ROSI|nr:hypothetical protein SLEP1_g42601 [Rubroshorea leprosula]
MLIMITFIACLQACKICESLPILKLFKGLSSAKSFTKLVSFCNNSEPP